MVEFVLIVSTLISGVALYIFRNLGEDAPHVLTKTDIVVANVATLLWCVLLLVTIITILF